MKKKSRGFFSCSCFLKRKKKLPSLEKIRRNKLMLLGKNIKGKKANQSKISIKELAECTKFVDD